MSTSSPVLRKKHGIYLTTDHGTNLVFNVGLRVYSPVFARMQSESYINVIKTVSPVFIHTHDKCNNRAKLRATRINIYIPKILCTSILIMY